MRIWLTVIVAVHLVVAFVHGFAHGQAHVPLSLAANLFVWIVIVAGPVGGAALMWLTPRAGAWLIAATLAAACVFGVVNHFVVASPDHVAFVAPRWQPLFATTAVLVALTEALGSVLAIGAARDREVS